MSQTSPRPARQLVLASTSPYRRQLLERLRLPFEAVAPDYREQNEAGAEPRALVLRQAEGKARSIAARFPRALIIGCDQAGWLDGQLLVKPGTHARAAEQLRAMSAKTHAFYTGVVLLDAATDQLLRHCDETFGTLRALSTAEIESYLRLDQPFDCAGSLKFESLGAALFRELRTTDPTAIIGLPLIALCEMLRSFGVDALDSL